jgi:tRNA(fMet)-specific endonuclease VapC
LTTFLLDSNACIGYLRDQKSLVAQRIHATPFADLSLCSVVVAELLFGAYASARPQANLAKVRTFGAQFLSLQFDDAAADLYGQIRFALESQGQPIGPNDMMIAAIARVHDLTLVTHNTGEFSRVPGLKIVDWTLP